MLMRMGVWFAAVPGKVVRVLVVFIVGMEMFVVQGLMAVLVFVVLADVEPDTHGHQTARDPEGDARHFAKQQ